MSNYDPQLALRQTIAGVLDHPSVYMGGPSRQHLRKADQIIECLRRDPRLIEALRAGMETGTARCTCKDFPGADEFCTAHTAPSTFPQHNCRHGHPDRSCRECFPLKAADGCNHPEGARSLTNRCLICDTQVVEQD